jgi:uncharacterized repeat protein (TIGR02543 family)
MKKTFFAIIIGIALLAMVTTCNNDNDDNNPATFTVTFDADNGTPAATQTITEGNTATKPADPEKTDHHFDYWFNTATTTEWDFTTPITANVSLKAKWTEVPKTQNATLSGLFDGILDPWDIPYSAAITGFLTDDQWAGVEGKIEQALNNAFNAGNLPAKGRFSTVFARGVTIIVGDRPANNNYETTDDGITLYLNLDCVNGTELQEKITAAVTAMRNLTPEVAKAIIPARKGYTS